jgi:translocation and assembly module TamB
VDRAEFNVPAGLGGSATLIDVRYVDPSYDVLQTLRRARAGPFAEPEERGERATGLRLDVSVSAPRRIFVRGRGVDAEFGGEVTLTGPVSDIRPVGAFEMIRGRIVILGQRIVFTEGEVTLLGELDPQIRLVAETQANQVTVRVIVTGSVRDPEIRFESEPELPQDEVLAQLLFGRSVEDLSAFQLARLAAAVAELAGSGGGPGFLEQVRVFSGLDNLEIVTTEEGGTAAQAGRYIADNVYLGVRAGARSSGVTVNLDVTRNLSIRAEALTDESSLGIYFEREY